MPSSSLLDRIAGWPWVEAATVLFGFAWGAMLGSFLNVVAHRVPRGESLVHHRSRCPRCGTMIRASDNVPVFGWLRLGGRCRDCGDPIAARYPLVEAGCGVLVMVLAWAELVGGGRWLPRLAEAFPSGIDRLLRGDWPLVIACCLHAAVVLTVVAWSLLDMDRNVNAMPATAPLTMVPLGLVLACIAALPATGPGGVLPNGVDWPPGWPRAQAVVAALTGAFAGWVLGRCSAPAGIHLGLPLLGSVLGWQVVTIVAVATAAIVRPAGATKALPQAAAGLVLAALGTLGIAFQGPLRGALATILGP